VSVGYEKTLGGNSGYTLQVLTATSFPLRGRLAVPGFTLLSRPLTALTYGSDSCIFCLNQKTGERYGGHLFASFCDLVASCGYWDKQPRRSFCDLAPHGLVSHESIVGLRYNTLIFSIKVLFRMLLIRSSENLKFTSQ